MIDALSQNMQGDADNNKEMQEFLQRTREKLRMLSDEPDFGLLVHHPGHSNKKRGRGASSLAADLDLIMHLTGNQDDLTLECERMRDGDRFEYIKLSLEKAYLPSLKSVLHLLADHGCPPWSAPSIQIVSRPPSFPPARPPYRQDGPQRVTERPVCRDRMGRQ